MERENSISSKIAITDPRTRPLLKNDARNGGSVEYAPAGTNITPTPVKIERPATLNNRSLSRQFRILERRGQSCLRIQDK